MRVWGIWDWLVISFRVVKNHKNFNTIQSWYSGRLFPAVAKFLNYQQCLWAPLHHDKMQVKLKEHKAKQVIQMIPPKYRVIKASNFCQGMHWEEEISHDFVLQELLSCSCISKVANVEPAKALVHHIIEIHCLFWIHRAASVFFECESISS